MKCQSALVAGVASSLIFVTLNVAMNLYMKWLFAPHGGNFALPWTMLAVQQFETYIVLQPWLAYADPDNAWGWGMSSNIAEEERIDFKALLQVLAVTVLFCLNVGLNSLSLVRISITLNQTVRAFLPVGVLFLASVLEQRTYPGHSYMTTALLVIGITLTCWGSPDFEFYGFGLAFASTLLAALGTSLNGRLLNAGPFSTPGKDKVMRLIMLQSVPAFFLFGTVAAWTEGAELRGMLAEIGMQGFYQKFGLVSFSSVLALMSNLGRLFLVAATSALMETLAGNAKVAALCIIDNQLFGTALNSYNYAGVVVTFLGFSVHLLLQYATKEEEPAKEDQEEDDKACMECADDGPQVDGAVQRELMHVRFKENADHRGRRVSTHIPAADTRRRVSTLISAGDTGLAAEHLALDYGRQKSVARRGSNHAVHAASSLAPSAPDQAPSAPPGLLMSKSMTWHSGSNAAPKTLTWLSKMNLDLAYVLETPHWLASPNRSRSGSGTGSFLTESDISLRGYQFVASGLHTDDTHDLVVSRIQSEPVTSYGSRSWLLKEEERSMLRRMEIEEEEWDEAVWQDTPEDSQKNVELEKIREADEEELEDAAVEDWPPIELAPL